MSRVKTSFSNERKLLVVLTTFVVLTLVLCIPVLLYSKDVNEKIIEEIEEGEIERGNIIHFIPTSFVDNESYLSHGWDEIQNQEYFEGNYFHTENGDMLRIYIKQYIHTTFRFDFSKSGDFFIHYDFRYTNANVLSGGTMYMKFYTIDDRIVYTVNLFYGMYSPNTFNSVDVNYTNGFIKLGIYNTFYNTPGPYNGIGQLVNENITGIMFSTQYIQGYYNFHNFTGQFT